MKKLFTLLALLTCFLGVKAVEIVDAEVDFSKYSDISEWGFPYGWGGSASAKERLSIVDGCLHFESTEATDPSWDCQFFPIGCTAEEGVTYTVHFKIKGDHAENVSLLGFGTTPYGQFPITTDWVEGTVTYESASSDGNLLMQCGGFVGSFDIAYLKITHDGKAERPITWLELMTDDGTPEGKYVGDAETPWPAWALETDGGINANWRTDRAPEICAWSLTMGRNFDDQCADFGEAADRARPYPTDIEVEAGNESNHVFAVHVDQIEKIDDDASIAWSNQFWIQAPKGFKEGASVKLSFRYKADHACSAGTQYHKKNPSVYNIWNAAGDVNFTTEWQTFEKTLTIHVGDSGDDTYSLCFNLCSDEANGRTPNVFYFDDLSWQEMKLDHGLFVATSNAATGLEYDLSNAIEFQKFDDLYSATVGTLGDESSWVNEVMISTVRGHDGSFKSATIKPSGTIVSDEDTWLDYTEKSNAKIKLPAAGVWTINIDMEGKQINFIELEGETPKDPVDIATNPTEIIINGVERDDIKSDDFPEGTGNAWDNQFFIVANRALDEGEVTVIKFSYMASQDDVKVTTQDHGEPGAYLHWAALGDMNFTGSWQDFEKEFTVPKEANGMKSFAFNMAEIKEACDYYVKNVQWYLKDDYNESGKTLENLINATGSDNFYVKVGAGTNPYIYGKEDGINDIVTKNSNASNAIFNVAGQKVDKNYKGLVIKNGKKMIQD
jgi:hypothetical protein